MDFGLKGERRLVARAFAGLTAMGVGAAMLVGALPGPAGATGGDDDENDNPTCEELIGGDGIAEFKIEAGQGEEFPPDGIYDDPNSDFEVTIKTVIMDGVALLSFEANTPVKAVFIKAGPGGELYEFDPATKSAADLASPKDSISHISFCFCEDKTSTTSSSTPEESTTSSSTPEESTTSSSTPESSSTSVEDTTSTSHAAPSSAPPTQPPSEGGGLPVTGSNTGLLVGMGSALLIAGALLVWSTRFRRERGAHAA